MTFEIEGEHNVATVHTNKPRSDCEDEAIEQIQQMVDAEAFEAHADEGTISIMPDFHWGSGAVIGFTMPIKDRIVPNTIGVDIGCGMLAVNFGEIHEDELDLEELDNEIRSRVPTGFDVHDRNDYHMKYDFPWGVCVNKLDDFTESTDFDIEGSYGPDYFDNLCKRVGYDIGRAINSLGTLGGGNHFIELGRDKNNELWCVIHSGSRGIGATIAQYWQDRATEYTTMRKSLDEVPDSVVDYMGDDWKPLSDKIRKDFEGSDIQDKFDEVSQAIQKYGPSTADRNTDLDYLKGDESHGYIKDMIFAQTYASESRREMGFAVAKALAVVTGGEQEYLYKVDNVESVHNYIDFEDATIRKGACRAHENERLIVPFNMKYGTIIARGKGEDAWNQSSAHGAGRAMSRRDAERQFTEADFAEQTDGVYMSETPMDEIPGAYKTPEDIEAALGGNVEVVNRITPFLSIKAE